MDPRQLIYHVDEEEGHLEGISPSKVMAWVVVVATVAYLGIWLWQAADPAQDPMSSELVAGLVALGGGALAYGLFHRPGTVLEEALSRAPGGDRST